MVVFVILKFMLLRWFLLLRMFESIIKLLLFLIRFIVIFVIDVLIGIFVFISVSEVLYIDVIEDELFDFVILEIICIMYGNFFLFGIIV